MKHKGIETRRHKGNPRKNLLHVSVSRCLGAQFDLSRLRSEIKPFRLHFFTRLKSTNDHATKLRKQQKLFAPAIVLTSHQIAGRGRGSNTWWSGDGSLTVTFVLPVQDHRLPHQIPLIAGLSVRNAIASHTGIEDIQLKWPNDLLHRGKKLAGLLCERLDHVDLIGLGVNVNVDLKRVPKALRDRVTSLSEISNLKFQMTDLLVDIARVLHQNLSRRDEPPFSAILREYDRHHSLVGKKVSIIGVPGEPPTIGTCIGLDSMGRLLVRTRSGTSHIIAGQVHL
jgi:BirA family transcriptional regulator, biotin operon repressor / biotin---[acetyl-CoA-carboxylase] ligase